MKKIILSLILGFLFVGKAFAVTSVLELAGEYKLVREIILDVEELTQTDRPELVAIKPRLIIEANGDIVWGAGKSHVLKLTSDLHENYADYTERLEIGDDLYITNYTLKVTDKHLILYSRPYHGDLIKYYFKR